MKDFVGLFFTLILGIASFSTVSAFSAVVNSTPVYAEDSTVIIDPVIETPADADKPGGAWDGVITDPGNGSIAEPAIPSEPQKTPEFEIVEVTTTVTPPATPVYTPVVTTAPAAAPAAAETPVETPAAETAPEETQSANTPEDAESTNTDATDENDFSVLVPETARPDTARKIRLMALVSTAIIFFSIISVVSGVKAYQIARSERKFIQKIEKVTRAKITRKA